MKKRSGFGWMELIEGVLLIILGVLNLIRPQNALTGIVMIFGLIAVITGIADIVFYIKMEMHTGFGPTISLISGILSVMAGFMLLVHSPLYLPPVTPEYYPHNGRELLLLFFTDHQHHRPGTGLPDADPPGDCSGVRGLYHRHIPDSLRRRQYCESRQRHGISMVV